jgi:flagellar basal body-associated protein FliL
MEQATTELQPTANPVPNGDMDEFETTARHDKKDNRIHTSKKILLLVGLLIFAILISIAIAVTLYQNLNRPSASPIPSVTPSINPTSTNPSSAPQSDELSNFLQRTEAIQSNLNNTPEDRVQLNMPNLDFSTSLR